MKAFSADNIELKPGMRIWVNNSIVGWPPTEQCVDGIINEFKIRFTKFTGNIIGARAGACWIDHIKAMEFAIAEAKKG